MMETTYKLFNIKRVLLIRLRARPVGTLDSIIPLPHTAEIGVAPIRSRPRVPCVGLLRVSPSGAFLEVPIS